MITFKSAVIQGKAAIASRESVGWTLGDIANTVRPQYADSTIAKLADAIDPSGQVTEKILMTYRTVAQTYPAGPARETGNSFTVYEIFSSKSFDADRTSLLASKVWRTADARALRSKRNEAAKAGKTSKTSEAATASKNDAAKRAHLAAEVKRLRGELARAEAALEKWDAAHPATSKVTASQSGLEAAIELAQQITAKAAKPAASKPAASKPAASKPAASKPAASKPAAKVTTAIQQATAAAKAARDANPPAAGREHAPYIPCSLASCKASKHVTGSPIAVRHAELAAAA